MYHSHTMPSMLESKMSAIISCYLLSPVPPRLQLDVPQEVADKVTNKDQMGPYVFREAQVHYKVLCVNFICLSCHR